MKTFVEYRVRPVTRYVVTRFERQESDDGTCGTCAGSSEKGEFDSAKIAYEVGFALAKEEHQRLGYPLDDERLRYPFPLDDKGRYQSPDEVGRKTDDSIGHELQMAQAKQRAQMDAMQAAIALRECY